MINKRLFNLVDGTKRLIFNGVFYQWLSLLMNIIFLFNIKQIFDKKVGSIFLWLLMQSFLILMKIIFISLSKKESIKTSNKVKESLRQQLYKFLISLGASYQTHIGSSTISHLITEGVDQLEVYFGLYLPQFFYAMVAPLTLFVFLSFFNFKVAIILLILVPLIPVSIVFVQKFAKRILNRYWGSYTELSSTFLDSLQGLSTLKFYQGDAMKHQQINEESESFRKATMRVLVMQLNSISVMDLVAYGGVMLAILISYKEYSNGSFSLGTFLMINLISSEFFIPMRLLGSYFHIAMNGAAAADRIFDILDIENKMIESIHEINHTEFTARSLNFSYDTKQVLYDINFEIKENSFVSFVGESGSGKSTILSLLAKHLETSNLTLDSNDIRYFNKDVFFNHILLVSSRSYLFKGSVRFNLSMNGIADDQKMIDILKVVDLWDMLESREGLDTEVKERASNFSGGEKQRLILARALLFNPNVYLFDEITSNVDVESEAIILDVINQLENKTIVMVSHRLRNVINSDIIYVLDDGKIVEEGTHNQLIKQNGLYSKSFKTQDSLERVEQP